MKIIIHNGKYLSDPDNAGLQASWSQNRCDAAPMTEETAAKKIAIYRMLCPKAVLTLADATPTPIPIPGHRRPGPSPSS